eukprot:1138215-Pelagomonas_calceolata.AAC.2
MKAYRPTQKIRPRPPTSKIALEIHAHSVKYAPELVTTRRAIESKNDPHSYCQVLEPGASRNPPGRVSPA